MPRLRVHNEGSKVRTGDPLLLVALEAQHCLALSGRSLISIDPAQATDSTNTGFRLRLYRSIAEEVVGVLAGGKACTLFHKEIDAFIVADAASGVRMLAGTTGPDAPVNAIWQLLHDEEPGRYSGGVCQWGGRFRLRHAATGCYLAVRASMEIALVHATESLDDLELTLFKFVPQYPMAGQILTSHFLRVVHVGTSAFLHAEARGGEDGSYIELTASTAGFDTDIFGIRAVESHVTNDVEYVLNALPLFSKLLEQVSPERRALDFKSVTARVIDLIRFVTESDNPDPFTREGIPIGQRQKMLAELGVLDLVPARHRGSAVGR